MSQRREIFWADPQRKAAAAACEAKDCRLFHDVLQGTYYVVRKHADGSVHHDKDTELFRSTSLRFVEIFINDYKPLSNDKNNQNQETGAVAERHADTPANVSIGTTAQHGPRDRQDLP